MAVDPAFYRNKFGGSEQTDIDRLLIRAERVISGMILSHPVGAVQENAYNFAVCAQAEYMGLCGGIEAWAVSHSGNVQSVSVGSFSMSQGSAANSSGISARGVSQDALSYLEISGLLERRCDVL